MTALLQLKDVEFSYPDGLQAVAGISLDIAPGEVVAIVGPSGCGKSTLLSMIAGLTHATSGSVTWGETGSDSGDLSEHQLSLLFQRDTVLPWRTVERNVAFGLENLKVPKPERKKRVDELLAVSGLQDFRKSYPRALSGGMRRRLALLMVMAVRPALLLLDEPFAAVDEPTRVGLLDYVLKIIYEYGSSAILVTHDLGEAISLGDVVVVLSSRPARILSTYRIPFGHERDVYTIRLTEEFQVAYQHLWAATWAGRTNERMQDGQAPSIH
jgi:NitT/TauT family transport system ATP-binding protein